MTDTPTYIKNIQLKIWLSKTPAQRLKQFLVDNEAFYNFSKKIKVKYTGTIKEGV